MALELNINGFFEVTFTNSTTAKEVSEDEEKIILDNLNSGEYLFGLNSKTIVSLDDMQTVLFDVHIDPTDAVNYEFDEI
jgi:hypothetical protein